MSGSQNSMLEDVNTVAARDESALSQVQQTAAKGEEHVQGSLLSAVLVEISNLYKACNKSQMLLQVPMN